MQTSIRVKIIDSAVDHIKFLYETRKRVITCQFTYGILSSQMDGVLNFVAILESKSDQEYIPQILQRLEALGINLKQEIQNDFVRA